MPQKMFVPGAQPNTTNHLSDPGQQPQGQGAPRGTGKDGFGTGLGARADPAAAAS